MTSTPVLPPGFVLPNPLWALTVSQPWPRMFLLDEAPKRLENRMWSPPREQLAYGGWFALHGGRLPKSESEFEQCREALDWVNLNVWDMSADPDEWAYPKDILESCVTGLFGLAKLKAVTTQRGQPWRTRDRYAWLLGDFIPLPNIPARGFRDLWEVSGEALIKVQAALGMAPAPLTPPAKAPVNVSLAPSPAQAPDGLFTPGLPVINLPPKPESGRMYGLRAGNDWVTVICEREKKSGAENYSWCSRLSDVTGRGNRASFETFVKRLRQVAA